MKKRFDAMTVISIVLIVITWIIFIINMNTGSRGCEFDDFAVFPTIFESLFGGIVYASNTLPQFNKVSSLDGIIGVVLGIIQMIAYMWCLILIGYPIIKFIKLYVSVKGFEESSEYELKKQEIKSVFKRNIILAILLYIPIYLSCIIENLAAKPIIYIYPETETTVQVSVDYPEKLSCVYPEYGEEGWEVIAKPNGDLVDTKTGRNLYCLYWEGNQKQEYKFKDGFVVTGEDSAKFLEEKLAILGLNEREANEFIIYWLPKLETNKYNLIRFETMEEIEEYMPLNIEPKPDTLIRVVMDFKGLNRPIKIEEQKLESVVREGYTVVEWGGSEF